ncbi:type III-A CRISPR-associated protein Cas10/Csm1 [Desulfurobacterium atlanticum]|uniref:CRISPR system single-strand-specific deoxyribonuclease Cas10/Csm1 (subtype III-A) n=1 Tax=Desulfurobacterium atlanticum TaxID=240169 RepID=A0A238XY46_9BACT|nr:type III-A CRISPR-associated protein Cas10/Csm1 [Desulfurobacterium atlanticum]SNR62909.1 CRISPR-associated protein Cas10/Csm1, subtype III-A/MTUBE [Desulfurobacterium atlanticum]
MESYLLKGDINGIQNFIYSVKEGKGGVAKTLRARSFFITTIPSYIAYFLKEKQHLEVEVCLDGGGGFIFKVSGENVESALKELKQKVEAVFIEKFSGELGITIEWLPSGKGNFSDLHEVTLKAKKRKFSTYFESVKNPIFLEDKGKVKCEVCDIYFTDSDDGICKLCKEFMEVGTKLPSKKFWKITDKKEGRAFFSIKEFGWLIFPKNGGHEAFRKESYRDSKCKKYSNAPKKFEIVVPVISRDLTQEDIKKYSLSEELENLKEHQIAPFEIIAYHSEGDKKLGYLMMDVDNLGLLFGQLDDVGKQQKLSSIIDMFFSEKIPEIAKAEKFVPENSDLLKETLIYLLYSGGDDLFAIAPWNVLIDFAVCVREKFKSYISESLKGKDLLGNDTKKDSYELITVSAGIYISKPKFNIRAAAEKCKDAEYRAKTVTSFSKKKEKSYSKDAVCVFDVVVHWDDINDLLSVSRDLISYIESGKLSRGFVYKLHSLYKEKIENPVNSGKRPDLSFYPLIYYFVGRNIEDDEVRNFVTEKVIKEAEDFENIENNKLKFITNYVLLATRRL